MSESELVQDEFEAYARNAPIFEDRMEYSISDLTEARGEVNWDRTELRTAKEAEQLQRMLHAGDPNYTPF